jgi:hypothetical protein
MNVIEIGTHKNYALTNAKLTTRNKNLRAELEEVKFQLSCRSNDNEKLEEHKAYLIQQLVEVQVIEKNLMQELARVKTENALLQQRLGDTLRLETIETHAAHGRRYFGGADCRCDICTTHRNALAATSIKEKASANGK